jgi:outer membrane protein assembly factor BamA
MPRCLPVVIAAAACGPAPPVQPPPQQPCTPQRIGLVTVTGASPQEVPQLAVLEGTLDDPVRTARIAGVARDALRAQGYAGAAIEIARRAGCGVELAVSVALGPRYRIREIAFLTEDGFPAAERFAAVEDALGTVNTVGGVYIAYRMTRALAELERRYRDAGWLEARVGAPRASYEPAATDSSGTIAIEIPVAAGQRFRIASVRARGAGAGARGTVLQSLGLRAGDYYDGPRIRAAIERARHRLARWIELRTRIADDRAEIDLEAIVEAAR